MHKPLLYDRMYVKCVFTFSTIAGIQIQTHRSRSVVLFTKSTAGEGVDKANAGQGEGECNAGGVVGVKFTFLSDSVHKAPI